MDETPEVEEPIPTRHPVGRATTNLVLPRSRMMRLAVTYAWTDAGGHQDQLVPVVAAALALCDEELGAHLAKARIKFDGNILALGYAVVDYLTGLEGDRAATMAQIIGAGNYAVAMCWRARRTEEAAAEARAAGFTTPSSDGSSSSNSTSSKPGAANPDGWVPSTPPTPSG